MKWAIFCLLAFRAIQPICATDLKDQKVAEGFNDLELSDAHDTSIYELLNMGFNVLDQVEDALKKVNNTESVLICYEDAVTTIGKHNNARLDECRKCHSKFVKNNNIQKATKCCDDVISAAKEEAKLDLASGKACIEKCAKPGAQCPTKFTEDTDGSKKNKNSDTEGNKTKNV